jgi:hypothetical protein
MLKDWNIGLIPKWSGRMGGGVGGFFDVCSSRSTLKVPIKQLPKGGCGVHGIGWVER